MANSSLYHVVTTGFLTSMLATMAMVGCSGADSAVDEMAAPGATPQPTPMVTETASHRFASWAGRWTGVEGMYVEITPTMDGQYRLEMQHGVDNAAIYAGLDEEHGIRFTRDNTPLLLYPTNGDESGLKYLAGKKDCLVVKKFEGYCRD